MGEWSPETHRAEWNDGFDGPAVGAEFTGHNRNGDKEWSTVAQVVELVADRRFFFDCRSGDFVFSKWGYEIVPTDTGCRVTESTQNLIPEEFRASTVQISGVENRLTHNRAGMEATLERLAAVVEG